VKAFAAAALPLEKKNMPDEQDRLTSPFTSKTKPRK
jgi:hypothetical protein